MYLKAMYKEYKKERQAEIKPANSKATIGGVYFGTLKKKPFWFIIVNQRNGFYEAMKCSDWICFWSSYNLLLDIGPIKLLIEPGNNFWFNKEEVSQYRLIHKVDDSIVKEILDYRENGTLKTLKKGLTPIFVKDPRYKFDQDEFAMIRDYHLRAFALCLMD